MHATVIHWFPGKTTEIGEYTPWKVAENYNTGETYRI